MPETPHILVVDDNAAAADGLVRLLKALGHPAQALYAPEDALAYEARERVSLAFVDIGMPGMDGYELIEKMRADGFGAPAFALSGYGQEEDRMRAREAGFTDHLTKPIGASELREVLAGHESS